jgi:hypothetical protein
MSAPTPKIYDDDLDHLPVSEEDEDIPILTPGYLPLVDEIKGMEVIAGADFRIIRELAAECDNLQQLVYQTQSSTRLKKSPHLIAQIITRRVAALKALADRQDSVRDRQRASNEVSLVAGILRLMKEALRECGIPNEAREVVIQSLAAKIAQAQEENSKRKKAIPITLPPTP